MWSSLLERSAVAGENTHRGTYYIMIWLFIAWRDVSCFNCISVWEIPDGSFVVTFQYSFMAGGVVTWGIYRRVKRRYVQ